MTEPQLLTREAVRHPLPSDLLHDLRTPLNHIIGYSEMLLEQAQEQGCDGFVPDLQKTHAAGRQLLALINEQFQAIRTAEPRAVVAAPRQNQTTPMGQAPSAPGFQENSEHGELASGTMPGFLLVVDDIENNRDVLTRRLERQGHTVATAENGRVALEMLRAESFDLVLLDIMMPEMDGYEVLRRLKADPALQHIPVIMISSLNELDSVAHCIELGAEDYLPKPFNPILLKARIGACLERKRARDREKVLFTQLQENYRRLQALEKLRDDLTHMVVHDLRTPLNTVFLGLHAFSEMGALNEAQREMLSITTGGGRTMVAIINNLLDISKMESGTLQLERQEIAAEDLIDAAVKQVAPLANARDLTLATALEPDLPRLMADEGQLLRTLVNLLSNAIKFTPAGGKVTVSARVDDDRAALRFSVSDTGEGIPPEAFGLIFEKFGQVESRESGRTMSTGLGLTFCKLVVEAHGGHIGVESVRGQGSTFSFTIPLPSPAE